MTVPDNTTQPDVTTQDPVVTEEPQAPEGNEGTGLYDQYLEKLPESVRPLVVDVFKEWDGNVTKRFNEVHSQYEPWKEVAEQYEPLAVQQAIAIANALESDPATFVQQVATAFGLDQFAPPAPEQQGQPEPQPAGTNPEEQYFDPRYDQLEQAVTTMMQVLINERQQQAYQAQDSALDQALSQLEAKHGAFDQDYVITKIANGVDPEKAIQQYQAAVQAAAKAQQTPAPKVMGGGGGVPSTQVQPSSLSGKQTVDLVTQILAQEAAQRNTP